MKTVGKILRKWQKKAVSEQNKTLIADCIANEYQNWRNNFLWQRLGLLLWLALICILTFTLRDVYNFFFPLKEFQNLPEVLRTQALVMDIAMLLNLVLCMALRQTKFGRQHPGILFLGSSWSINLIPQIFATLKGFALPDTLAWSLLFLSQATFIPVCWKLHLISQLGLFVYYFGLNTVLGLKLPLPEHPELYNVTFILYLFWFCAICNLGVYLYDCLQRSEFFARKELEFAYEKLRVAEAKYRSIFENAVEGIFQSTPDGRYITANPALARIYGYSSPTEVTTNFTDIENQLYVDPQRRAEFVRLIEEYGKVSEFESQIYRQDGSIVWISEKAYAVRDESGKLLYYEGLIEDITKRKQAEAALQEQLDFLQVLIDTIPTPVFYKNAEGFYLGCNKAFEEALGFTREQIVGKSEYDISPKELADKYQQADTTLFEQRGIQSYEDSVVYKDGKKHDVIFYKATFSKADGSLGGLVGVILDISDRKRTEEALRVFVHAVSHDLRNPVLGTLMVLNNLLSQGQGGRFGGQESNLSSSSPLLSSSIPVPRSILERMKKSSERQLNLINSLMEAHISEVQGIVLQRQPVKLHKVVEDAIADLQPMLTENQISLTNLVKDDLPLVNADPTQLWRVFSNLIVNAVKHNPPGLDITINAIAQGDQIYCTVVDNGVGLSQKQSERLFDLYFRGSNNRNSVSLGLGLYLSKRIINAHGGEIGVNSTPDQGATFWFTLPVIHDP
ncbi:sensor histidine kinase [Fischerella thermalis]|uniref:sensor histidine kinase n=2 Tax=Fischerella thermalis TaxID=372787 RepID=UPI0019DC0EAB|nr:PAS domain-containing sensor histidine kinase [Fischerella thermalis]MBF1989409.1 PAS domain S-box protein [Fischerella thermalis M58_A2018_009]MBF2069353.1 PAS domain S-box protein [Fischerella thermalis M48_A2018_028]